jgi:hypothetical protein
VRKGYSWRGAVIQRRLGTRETEECPMLEAVARARLLKTQQAGKDLADIVVICEI